MNPRIEKLRGERNRLAAKLNSYQSRLKALDEQILKLENTDIVGIVRESMITPEQLAGFVKMLKTNPAAVFTTEYAANETEDD